MLWLVFAASKDVDVNSFKLALNVTMTTNSRQSCVKINGGGPLDRWLALLIPGCSPTPSDLPIWNEKVQAASLSQGLT